MGTTSLESDLLDQLADCLTPESAERLVALRLDPRFQERLDELAEKCNFGSLTPDEDAEHAELVQLWQVVTLLQLRARKSLANSPAAN